LPAAKAVLFWLVCVPPRQAGSPVAGTVVFAKVNAPGAVGNTSVNETPVAAVLVGLFSVIVRTLLTLVPTTAGENDLVMIGTATFRSALVATELVPAELLSAPTGMMFA
jgi:hypothetical protein